MVQILLDNGADINAQGGRYSTALQAASAGGHNQVVQILLDNGADVNAQGGSFGNALQAALLGDSNQVVQTLLDKGADVNTLDEFFRKELYAGLRKGKYHLPGADAKIPIIRKGSEAEVHVQGNDSNDT